MVMHPETIEQALDSLQQPHAAPVAGGTDFMIFAENRETKTPVFLNRIAALQEMYITGDTLHIGAARTFASLHSLAIIPAALRSAMHSIASPAIRNIATIGGNICNASPAADTLPVLYALDASVTLQSLQGSRTLPIAQFIQNRKQTALRPGELLVCIHIPLFEGHQYFRKVSARKAQALSKCSLAVCAKTNQNGVETLRIAFGAMGLTVLRDPQIEAKLVGQSLAYALHLLPNMLREYEALLSPIDDARSTAVYRRTVCLRLLEDHLRSLLL